MSTANSRSRPQRRVVVTGVGALSSLGCDLGSIDTSLRTARSGVVPMPEWEELGLSSTVAGDVGHDERHQERCERSRFTSRQLQTMGPVAALCALATEEALANAAIGADADLLGDRRFACLVGSGVSSMQSIYDGAKTAYGGRARRVRPHAILQGMSSTVTAHLVQHFGFGGRSYTISSACSTSSHSIGHATELIRAGLIDRAVVGGGDEVGTITAAAFNALRAALSTGYNDQPHRASRPFDKGRDGFVLSGGAGVVVLEGLDAAQQRGARPRLEILGFGANSDAHDMVLPEAEGRSAADCMRAALQDAGLAPDEIDYINAHGTGTPAGDLAEANAVRAVFGSQDSTGELPLMSAPKSLAGHALGAAGALEMIYSLLMIEGDYLLGSANLDEIDPSATDLNLIPSAPDAPVRATPSKVHLSNSFGFGGTNATLVVGEYETHRDS